MNDKLYSICAGILSFPSIRLFVVFIRSRRLKLFAKTTFNTVTTTHAIAMRSIAMCVRSQRNERFDNEIIIIPISRCCVYVQIHKYVRECSESAASLSNRYV